MTEFPDITSSDYCGLYLDYKLEVILNLKPPSLYNAISIRKNPKFVVSSDYQEVQKIFENESRTK